MRQKLIRAIRPILERQFPDFFTSTADLYVYFYKRGTELLRVGGILTYISSNKFLRAGYGRKLRQFFTDKVSLHKLLDFGSVPVFRANVDTCIVLVENVAWGSETFLALTFRDKADIPRLSEVFQKRAFSMHTCDLPADGWTLTSPEILRFIERLENTGTPLEEYVDGGFYRGIVTGCNEAFVINESVRQQLIAEDVNSAKIIKPWIRGREIRRWKTLSANEYLIAIASSANRVWPWSSVENALESERIFEETYPAIYQHLKSYQEQLIDRDDQGTFYWELRSCTYYAEFEKPKIIYPDIGKFINASYDTIGLFCGADWFVPTNDLSLLAILNSTLFDWYARHRLQSLNDPWAGGRLRFKRVYMRYVPIAVQTAAEKAKLSRLVERILANPESNEARNLQKKIDAQVYQLYGLADEDIALIEQTYEAAGMRR